MHCVVELFFDAATEEAVRGVWRALASAGFAAPGPSARPHVSVVSCAAEDAARCRSVVGQLAGESAAGEAVLASWGAFRGSENVGCCGDGSRQSAS